MYKFFISEASNWSMQVPEGLHLGFWWVCGFSFSGVQDSGLGGFAATLAAKGRSPPEAWMLIFCLLL